MFCAAFFPFFPLFSLLLFLFLKMALRKRLKKKPGISIINSLRQSMQISTVSNHRPAACFELFDTPKAALLTVSMQILTMLLEVAIYFILESKGFFVSSGIFRMVLLPVATVYIGGAILAAFGILMKRRLFITIHTTITMTLMFLTDALAISIIFLMAIGKRSTYLNQLPGQFVNENKFYRLV